jgi:uncharacterized membrane protein
MSKSFWIQAFVFLHVLGAICALGPTLTYALWRRRAETAGPEHLVFVLRTVGWVDGRLATPAYVAQAVTGVALILLEGLSVLHTPWLLVGVGIYVIIAVAAPAVYVPLVRKQMALAEAMQSNPGDPRALGDYAAASARSRTVGLAIVALTIAIVYFMVVKPPLWS